MKIVYILKNKNQQMPGKRHETSEEPLQMTAVTAMLGLG